MNVSELIASLEEHDDQLEIRIAFQPSWALHASLRTDLPAVEADLATGPVLYLVQGEQLGYLPGAARDAIGW